MALYEGLLDQTGSRSQSSASQESLGFGSTVTSVPMGTLRRGFATASKAEFEKAFGKSGDKLSSMTITDFSKVASKITVVFGAHRDKWQKSAAKLADYCPWMAEFSPTNMGRDLEIPGKQH